jgi:hypothetical protein
MTEFVAGFFIGGIVVSCFALLGEIFQTEEFRRPVRSCSLHRACNFRAHDR